MAVPKSISCYAACDLLQRGFALSAACHHPRQALLHYFPNRIVNVLGDSAFGQCNHSCFTNSSVRLRTAQSYTVGNRQPPKEEAMATTYSVTARLNDGFKTDVKVRHHKLTLDEPTDRGGQDAGADPFEYLAAALAGCTAMTLRAYANHKKIALDGVDLEYQVTRRDPSEVVAAGANAKTVAIKKRLKFSEKVPADLRAKLLEIANKCPVNKALLEGCEITGELA